MPFLSQRESTVRPPAMATAPPIHKRRLWRPRSAGRCGRGFDRRQRMPFHMRDRGIPRLPRRVERSPSCGATARICYRSRWSLRSRLRLPATDARSARGVSKLPREEYSLARLLAATIAWRDGRKSGYGYRTDRIWHPIPMTIGRSRLAAVLWPASPIQSPRGG